MHHLHRCEGEHLRFRAEEDGRGNSQIRPWRSKVRKSPEIMLSLWIIVLLIFYHWITTLLWSFYRLLFPNHWHWLIYLSPSSSRLPLFFHSPTPLPLFYPSSSLLPLFFLSPTPLLSLSYPSSSFLLLLALPLPLSFLSRLPTIAFTHHTFRPSNVKITT